MSRKSYLTAAGIMLVLLGCIAAGLILLIRHEPAAYRRTAVPPGPDRTERSGEAASQFSALYTALQTGNEFDWAVDLTDEQINSYFAEDFKQSNLDRLLLPEGISEPRVLFEPNRMRLAFRYGKGLWSSIISIDFAVWLTPERNVVALKLLGLQAGSLPIGAQTLLDNLSELVENNGVQIDWYRHEGRPVALLRFQPGQNDSAVELQAVQLGQGSIQIRGKRADAMTTRTTAALPTPRAEAGN